MKNPAHERACRLEELTIGTRVALFNKEYGVMERGVIVSTPYEGYLADGLRHDDAQQIRRVILLQADNAITLRIRDLAVCGVIPEKDGSWNETNFVVLDQYVDRLPLPTGPRRHAAQVSLPRAAS